MRELTYEILKKAEEQFGESFYLLDCETFAHNYEDLLNAFRKYYSNSHIAYSYKTNYIPRLCRLIRDRGGYAEVVSELELWLALKLSMPGEDIYYNGPWKKEPYAEQLMCLGGHINLDSLREAGMIERIAGRHPDRRFGVGIRCNMDIGQPESSRFGMDMASGELEDAFRRLNSLPNVKVAGLHCHVPFRDLGSFEKRMGYLQDLLGCFPGYSWEYISMGGGYMGRVSEEFSREFSFEPPAYEDYARVVAGAMKMLFPQEQDTKLLIEPGSALAADAMRYVTKAVSVKTSRGRKIAVLTGSRYQINPSVKSVRRPIRVYHNAGAEEKLHDSIDMAGYTCIEDDYLYRGYKGQLSEGDYVVFGNAGSYSIVMKPPFILPDVPVLEIDKKGNITVVCQEQEPEDIFGRMLDK